MKLTVNLGKNSYPIHIENYILRKAGDIIAETFSGKRIMIVSDDNVYPLYGDIIEKNLCSSYECHHLILPHGEATKSFRSLPEIYSAMLKAKISRSDAVIALGGGVIGDLAGFAAASFLRGVKFIQIPTSLLAQVDSSVGGKVAVDLPEGKNLVGAFYQPSVVLIDPFVLSTLNKRYINDGMGEVIKYGCIRDNELFQTLEKHSSFDSLRDQLENLIKRCVDIKRTVVEHDEFDTGERMLLNFGHTLGHTIEQYYQYSRESHGEAVAIGMYQISLLAQMKGLTQKGVAARILDVLETYDLPSECNLPMNALTEAIRLDKKNLGGHLNIVLLHDIGDSYVHPTSIDFFERYNNLII